MSSAQVDVLLLESGASLEIDDNNLYYLKIRFFPAESFLDGTSATFIASYCDRFYHPNDSKERCGDTYFREREILDKGSTKIVKQYCKNLTNFAHCYQEEKLESLPVNMSQYVCYKFNRSKIAGGKISSDIELYADTVFEPVDYSIVTMRVQLQFNPTEPDFFNKLQVLLAKYESYKDYPVYTKFMLVLKCSAVSDLYEGLYGMFDPTRNIVPNAMEKVFRDKSALLRNRDYIWFVCNQIEHAQLMHNTGYTEAECFIRLRTLRPTGNEYIDCGDDQY